MNILLLGNGGREHTLAWKIAQSAQCERLYVAPGNAGTAELAENIDLGVLDFAGIREFVISEKIDFVVVGPEAPLVEGIVDFFRNDEKLKKVPVLGPDKEAAQLEGSKAFAKEFMARHGIPTAGYIEVTDENTEEGLRYLSKMEAPYVLKADGLAAGKGVLILTNRAEAEVELKMMLGGKFGDASRKVVIEEFLDGTEFSVFALTDGQEYILLPEAKDYKRIGEGDTGLNTGGMGSVSPVPFFEGAFRRKVIDKIVKPTIEGIKKDGLHYTGFVFFGLIKVGDDPYVIEYNVRMGDPETQSVIPRIENDLVEFCYKAAQQELQPVDLHFSQDVSCTVVVVSDGYPEAYEKGKVIHGLNKVKVQVFHAGTLRRNRDIVTNGGRVLAVTALDADLEYAIRKALEGASKIQYDGVYYRRDIGQDLLGLYNGLG